MFGPQATLFKIFGFEIKLDFSWVFIALLIAWSLASGYFPSIYEGLPTATYWWMGIVAALGLFFSIVFHELSHSLVARRYGIQIKGITLFMLGGVAEMGTEPKSPRAEFMMAIAGPLASIFLGLVFYVLAAAVNLFSAPEALYGVFSYLAFLNGVIAVFNMVPAFPLDGGRVFRAALWQWRGDYNWATGIAAKTGAAFGLFLIVLGIFDIVTGNFLMGLWWFLIGMFVRAAAASQIYQMRVGSVLENKTVAMFMTADPVTVSPDISVNDLVEDYVYKFHHKLFPVVDSGELVGCVTTNEIKNTRREDWQKIPVGDIMKPRSADNTIDAGAEAAKALGLIQQTRYGRLMVTENNKLVGVISLKDLLEMLSLRMELETSV
ncbi:MAG: site-2 protease family protein [Fimbriimonadaceae bacterium]|nr:site-2 protease family protein [Alphaproteobacteria bacterium]